MFIGYGSFKEGISLILSPMTNLMTFWSKVPWNVRYIHFEEKNTNTHTHILYMRWCDLLIVGIGSLNNTIGFENKLGDPDCQICTPMLKFRRFNMVCVLYSHKRNFPAGPCQIPHWMFQYPGWRKIVRSWHAESTRTQGNHHYTNPPGKTEKKKAMTHKCRLVVGGCVWSFPGVPFFFVNRYSPEH